MGYINSLGSLYSPGFALARKTPQFEAMVRRIGLFDYWRSSGRPRTSARPRTHQLFARCLRRNIHVAVHIGSSMTPPPGSMRGSPLTFLQCGSSNGLEFESAESRLPIDVCNGWKADGLA